MFAAIGFLIGQLVPFPFPIVELENPGEVFPLFYRLGKILNFVVPPRFGVDVVPNSYLAIIVNRMSLIEQR